MVLPGSTTPHDAQLAHRPSGCINVEKLATSGPAPLLHEECELCAHCIGVLPWSCSREPPGWRRDKLIVATTPAGALQRSLGENEGCGHCLATGMACLDSRQDWWAGNAAPLWRSS